MRATDLSRRVRELACFKAWRAQSFLAGKAAALRIKPYFMTPGR